MPLASTLARTVMLLAAGAIAACGGGGGGGTFGGTSPPPPGGSGWQPGVFLPASTYQNQCQILNENNFLRSLSDDTYLWYAEIVDQDPGLFSDPLNYFDELRTTAITPSGADKDKFHFTYDTAEWLLLSQSGASAGYGAQLAFISSTPPRKILIAYTDPNSPATNLAVPLGRGAEFISVDGVPVVDGDPDVLNAAFFPSGAGETHLFEVLDLGESVPRTVSLTSEIVVSAPVQYTKVIDAQNGDKIGYLLFNDHVATAEQALIDAVNQLNAGQSIDDLVLDLRYNGGGYLAIASELGHMIAGAPATFGQTFELLQFNDKHPQFDPITGQALSPTPFYDTTLGPPFTAPPGQALPTLDLSRVFVITGPGTCSASEAIMNGLRGIGIEVIQIGSTTCGKPYGFYAIGNCDTTYFTIQFRGVNAMNFGDYTDGFSPANTQIDIGTTVPGCSVADDFTAALGDPNEGRLAATLNYRETQLCPNPPTGFSQPGSAKPGAPISQTDAIVPKSPWQMNRILIP